MPAIPELRSPYAQVGPLVYFGRMLDKIRLHSRSGLNDDYTPFLGKGLDLRTCNFLRISYEDLRDRTLSGGTDEEILDWAFTTGGNRSEHDCVVWNQFVIKLGWNDDRTSFLHKRLGEEGLTGRGIHTFFDWIEVDEERDPTRRGA